MRYDLAVIPGDGTGPEVVNEGLKVLKAAASRAGFSYDLTSYDFGAERYLRTGETLPDSAIDELRGYDAIFLGAIGHPDVKPGILEQGILLKARFALDLYINLRPVKLFPGVETPIKDKGPADIDFVVVRENTEGLYASTGGFLKKGTPDEIAVQESVNTRKGAERCIRYAYEYASRPDRHGQTDPLWQDQRAHLRLGSLVAGVQRGRRGRLSDTSRATTPTSTPSSCGSSRTRSGSTSSSPTTCSATSSPTWRP